MANEFRHADIVAGRITEDEYEAVGEHIFNSQAEGDIMYASSATQLSRLGITNNRILISSGDVPTWSNTLPAVTLGGTIAGGAQELNNLGVVYIGDTANAKMALGLTINQGAADDEIFACKSSDIAHGATALAETDTYMSIRKWEADGGGVFLRAFSDADMAAGSALGISASAITSADTTKSTAARGIIELYASGITGTGYDNVVANGNIFVLRARVGGTWITGLILDEDGDLWLNGGFGMAAVTPQVQQAHIIDADGNLDDITTKFNTLLADLEGYGFLANA